MDPAEPIASSEPADPSDRIDPTDPIDRIDPADPIDRTDPADPIEVIEPTDDTESIDPTLAIERSERIDMSASLSAVVEVAPPSRLVHHQPAARPLHQRVGEAVSRITLPQADPGTIGGVGDLGGELHGFSGSEHRQRRLRIESAVRG